MSEVLGSRYGKRPLRGLLSAKKVKAAAAIDEKECHEISIEALDENQSLLTTNANDEDKGGTKQRFMRSGSIIDVWHHMTTFVVSIRRKTWSSSFYNAARHRRGGLDRLVSWIAHLVIFIVATNAIEDDKNFITNNDLHYSTWPKDTCPGDQCKLQPIHTSVRTFKLLSLIAFWGIGYATVHVLVEMYAASGARSAEILDRWFDIIHVCMLNFFINSINGQTDILTHSLMFLFNVMLFLYIENLAHNPGGCYWKNVVGCRNARNIELPFVTLIVGVNWFVALFPTVHENSDYENSVPTLWSLVPFALLMVWFAEVLYMYRSLDTGLGKYLYGPQSTTYRLFSAWAKHLVYILVVVCAIRYSSKVSTS